MNLINEVFKKGKKKTIRLSDMKNFFYDKKALKLLNKNPIIYTVLVLEKKGINFAITIIEAGKIGKEFYMTRGHYHKNPVPEIYNLIEGDGILLLQNKDIKKIKMKKNELHKIPSGYAHRAINIGKKKLIFLSIYPSNAGHDYKKIEKKGFKKRILR